jgi:hypothetical protein
MIKDSHKKIVPGTFWIDILINWDRKRLAPEDTIKDALDAVNATQGQEELLKLTRDDYFTLFKIEKQAYQLAAKG